MASVRTTVVDYDLGWIEFFKRIHEIKTARVKVGVLASEEASVGGAITVGELAAVHEFGTRDGRIPSRSFLRSTFDEQREMLVELGKKLMGAVLDGKMKTERALGFMGAKLTAEVKKKISSGDGIPPPNAPSTIAAKGSSHTLIDTGRLLGAIAWAVVMGGEETE